MLLAREQVLLGREQVLLGREQVLLGREQVLLGREQVLLAREQVLLPREQVLHSASLRAPPTRRVLQRHSGSSTIAGAAVILTGASGRAGPPDGEQLRRRAHIGAGAGTHREHLAVHG